MAGLFKTAEIGFATAQRIEDLVRYAQLAEASGFTSFWLGERYYARGIYTTATAIAAATKTIKIGLGIVSPFTRHPSMIAMETAALDEFSRGRVMLGLGVSQISALRQGVENTRPATSLKETIEIVRGFFAGDAVVYDGQLFEMNEPGGAFIFEPYRADIPIHIGGMGPKSLELAGRMAASEILGMFSTPGFRGMPVSPSARGLRPAAGVGPISNTVPTSHSALTTIRNAPKTPSGRCSSVTSPVVIPPLRRSPGVRAGVILASVTTRSPR